MLKTFHTTCTDCVDLEELICSIDGALTRYAKSAWANVRFDLDKSFPREHIKTLIRYKGILQKKLFNPDYICSVPMARLVAHIKLLTFK